jgi:ubiquinone/menaquinone biosynthesis C-methylase UbiE
MNAHIEPTDSQHRTFIPAAGRAWLLPLYDPLVKLFGGDRARMTLLERAELRPGHRVLDIGCGTGTLLALIKRLRPGVDAIGIDPDPKALARARSKADKLGLAIQFDRGFADALPYPDGSFDRVFSSFMLHHLDDPVKAATLREVRRVLSPSGSLHLLDFAAPEDQLLALMRDAGFVAPTTVARGAMLFGRLSYCTHVAHATASHGS